MDISLNTGDIESAAQQLKTKAGEMEQAIQTAESSISPLRSMKSPRIVRDLETWDSLKKNFETALQSLLEASNELVKAAEANVSANQ